MKFNWLLRPGVAVFNALMPSKDKDNISKRLKMYMTILMLPYLSCVWVPGLLLDDNNQSIAWFALLGVMHLVYSMFSFFAYTQELAEAQRIVDKLKGTP